MLANKYARRSGVGNPSNSPQFVRFQVGDMSLRAARFRFCALGPGCLNNGYLIVPQVQKRDARLADLRISVGVLVLRHGAIGASGVAIAPVSKGCWGRIATGESRMSDTSLCSFRRLFVTSSLPEAGCLVDDEMVGGASEMSTTNCRRRR